MTMPLEPEIVNAWVRAQQRGELTLAELAGKLGCDETAAQALVDDAYRAVIQDVARDKFAEQPRPETRQFPKLAE